MWILLSYASFQLLSLRLYFRAAVLANSVSIQLVLRPNKYPLKGRIPYLLFTCQTSISTVLNGSTSNHFLRKEAFLSYPPSFFSACDPFRHQCFIVDLPIQSYLEFRGTNHCPICTAITHTRLRRWLLSSSFKTKKVLFNPSMFFFPLGVSKRICSSKLSHLQTPQLQKSVALDLQTSLPPFWRLTSVLIHQLMHMTSSSYPHFSILVRKISIHMLPSPTKLHKRSCTIHFQ